jgi:hypothetical protein
MSLKTRNVLILVGLFFVAATTFVLPTVAASSSAGVRRNMAEVAESDLDAQFLKKKEPTTSPTTSPTASPTASPTPRPIDWVVGELGQSCNQVCAAADGICNRAAQNAVDTQAELEFVVEVALGRPTPPGQGYAALEGAVMPAFQFSGNGDEIYFFNPPTTIMPGTCEGTCGGCFRICCCAATEFCPTSA